MPQSAVAWRCSGSSARAARGGGTARRTRRSRRPPSARSCTLSSIAPPPTRRPSRPARAVSRSSRAPRRRAPASRRRDTGGIYSAPSPTPSAASARPTSPRRTATRWPAQGALPRPPQPARQRRTFRADTLCPPPRRRAGRGPVRRGRSHSTPPPSRLRAHDAPSLLNDPISNSFSTLLHCTTMLAATWLPRDAVYTMPRPLPRHAPSAAARRLLAPARPTSSDRLRPGGASGALTLTLSVDRAVIELGPGPHSDWHAPKHAPCLAVPSGQGLGCGPRATPRLYSIRAVCLNACPPNASSELNN